MQFDIQNKMVIVPWDFSEMSRDALVQATEMVDDIERIQVIHVTQFPPALEYGVVWETISEETITKNLRDSFAKEIENDARLSDVSFRVLFGDPGRQICEFAKDNDAAIIVMPSHGRSGFSRMLLGSVAERVIRLAPCPVLVLRHEATGTHTDAEKATTAAN